VLLLAFDRRAPPAARARAIHQRHGTLSVQPALAGVVRADDAFRQLWMERACHSVSVSFIPAFDVVQRRPADGGGVGGGLRARGHGREREYAGGGNRSESHELLIWTRVSEQSDSSDGTAIVR